MRTQETLSLSSVREAICVNGFAYSCDDERSKTITWLLEPTVRVFSQDSCPGSLKRSRLMLKADSFANCYTEKYSQ